MPEINSPSPTPHQSPQVNSEISVSQERLQPFMQTQFAALYRLLEVDASLKQAYLPQVDRFMRELADGKIDPNQLEDLAGLAREIGSKANQLFDSEADQADFSRTAESIAQASEALSKNIVADIYTNVRSYVENVLGGKADNQTLLFLVTLENADLLSDLSKQQMEEIKKMNETLLKVNDYLAQVRDLKSKADKNDQVVPAEIIEFFRAYDVPVDNYTNKEDAGELAALIEHMSGVQNNLTSDNQMEMTVINMSTAQEKAAWETLGNNLKKELSSMEKIASNLRM